MKHSLLLFLSVKRLQAQLMAEGQIAAQKEFPDTLEGQASFSAFLQTAKCPTYMLIDLIEEDFRRETVPHLTGSTRTALLQRKFEQFYRGTPFRQAVTLQRQKTGRRDVEMLFSGLTNPSLITPWLDIMLDQQIPIVGIYSVPQISAPLVKSSPSNHLLLISWGKHSGLRQTYFSDHHLQISRLTPVHDELTFQDAVVKELARTYQYLKSLSLLPVGQILDVVILCHSSDRSELRAKLTDDADMSIEFSDIEETGKQLKVNYPFTDSDATQIYLNQLITFRPNTNYANAEHVRYYNLWQLRRVLNWGSAVVLIACVLGSTGYFWQSNRNSPDIDSLEFQAQHMLREAQQITQSLPPTHAPAADMKASVSVMQKLKRYEPAPSVYLDPISAALDHFPQIRVNELGWQASATEPVASNTVADVPAQVITLKGDLRGFNNDFRSALAYLDRFQLDLSKRGFQVTALTKPLDTSPGGSLADKPHGSV